VLVRILLVATVTLLKSLHSPPQYGKNVRVETWVAFISQVPNYNAFPLKSHNYTSAYAKLIAYTQFQGFGTNGLAILQHCGTHQYSTFTSLSVYLCPSLALCLQRDIHAKFSNSPKTKVQVNILLWLPFRMHM
jgi:hypothetical protein